MYKDFVEFVQNVYQSKKLIPLHVPCFIGNEKKYIADTIDSTFVSSVGEYVNEFERKVSKYTGAKYAIATVNGTSALHICLLLVGVKKSDEVLTQSLTFVATCNAIHYCGATPVFIDIDKNTLGLSADSLETYLFENSEVCGDGLCRNKRTKNVIRACVPMHTFGHPVEIDKIKQVCDKYNIEVVEDAAESLGSFYRDKHTGTTGKISAISFNGNKIITTGGGGMILTNNDELAKRAKHLTTTAKIAHPWEYVHDQIGFNYRMPNLNAALGCAQIESLSSFVQKKRKLASQYISWGQSNGLQIIQEPENAQSNYWLNTVMLESIQQRNEFLDYTNNHSVMTRPIWQPMHELPMFKQSLSGDLSNTNNLSQRLVNVPSSVIV